MITAQHIYDYLACPHRVYLNAHEDPAKKRPLSQFLDLLFRRGTLYEKRTLLIKVRSLLDLHATGSSRHLIPVN